MRTFDDAVKEAISAGVPYADIRRSIAKSHHIDLVDRAEKRVDTAMLGMAHALLKPFMLRRLKVRTGVHVAVL